MNVFISTCAVELIAWKGLSSNDLLCVRQCERH